MPSRCVLNGLEVDPVPQELESLDPLSKQMIQRAKAFQAAGNVHWQDAQSHFRQSL